jgi:hypothetical protein
MPLRSFTISQITGPAQALEESPVTRLRCAEDKPNAIARKLTFGLTTLALLAMWIYVIVRAATVSFTNDETISYSIIHGAQTFVDTANNQWLNTQLMRVSQYFFGQSELALRLPNVAAFGLYGIASVALLSRVQRLEARVVGFALLLVNPFLIEFFALARGYGLSVGFSVAAAACVFFGGSSTSARGELGRLILTGIFGSLAFYANFSALNIVLGLLAVEMTGLVVRGPQREILIKAYYRLTAAVVLGFTSASLVPGILQLRHLQAIDQLYYGGHTSFVTDTIGSLLGTSSCGYGCTPSWLTVGEIVIAVVAGLALMWAAARYVHTPIWRNVHRAALLFTIAIVAALLEFWLLGALYPIDRTALNYLVPFGLLVAFFVDDVVMSFYPRTRPLRLILGVVIGCFLALTTANFVEDANFTQTTIWTFDASSREAINAVLLFEQRHGRPRYPWKLIAGFPRNEALNYYRLRFKMNWLQPVTREPVSTSDGDLYYVSVGEVPSLPHGTRLLASFLDTRTQLRMAPRITSSATLAQPDATARPQLSVGSLPTTANPPPQAPQVTWSTGNGSPGIVTVSSNGLKETFFAWGPEGSASAPWLSAGHAFVFRLYSTAPTRRLLARLQVDKMAPAEIVAMAQAPRATSTSENRLLELLSFGLIFFLALLAAMYVREVRKDV